MGVICLPWSTRLTHVSFGNFTPLRTLDLKELVPDMTLWQEIFGFPQILPHFIFSNLSPFLMSQSGMNFLGKILNFKNHLYGLPQGYLLLIRLTLKWGKSEFQNNSKEIFYLLLPKLMYVLFWQENILRIPKPKSILVASVLIFSAFSSLPSLSNFNSSTNSSFIYN